jgi:hydrogenase expression/formation protein HypD
MRNLLETADMGEIGRARIDGFIGPSHVSTVIGTAAYDLFAEMFHKPVVVTGFEPLDVMQAILMLVRQVNEGRSAVENQYVRAVTREGNRIAQAGIAEIFELRESFEWRGLGSVPFSALRLKEAYAGFDAERRFGLDPLVGRDNPACECGAILRGVKTPTECKLFGTVCTPDTPMGSCMVSAEGACAAHWTYGRFRDRARRVA